MKIVFADMWSVYERADYFIFTGNGTLSPDNKLTMAAGMAREVLNAYKGIDVQIGRAIQKATSKRRDSTYLYGLVVGKKVGVFQTKLHWQSPSDTSLILLAVDQLCERARKEPGKLFVMNCPGTGLGGLQYSDVVPLLYRLPDNVHVYTKTVWWERDHYGLHGDFDQDVIAMIESIEPEPDNFFNEEGSEATALLSSYYSQRQLRQHARRFIVDYHRSEDWQKPELYVRASWLTPERQADIAGRVTLCEPLSDGAALVTPVSETQWTARYGSLRLSDVRREGAILPETEARVLFPQFKELEYVE